MISDQLGDVMVATILSQSEVVHCQFCEDDGLEILDLSLKGGKG